MSVQTQKNTMSVLVAKDHTEITTATVQITDPSTAGTFIADGQVVILDSSDNVMTPGTTVSQSPYFRIVAREGATASTAKLNYSARMRGVDLLQATYKAYSAPVEQISYVGYNGTTGSIDNTGTDYLLTVVNDWDDQMWSQQKNRTVYDYTSTAPTQLTIAKSFSYQVNQAGFNSTLLGTGPWIKAEMLNDSTTASNLTGSPTITIVNGSDVATFSNTVATNGLAVGDILRIGGNAASTTTAVYYVSAVPSTDSSLTSSQVKLHTYYQGVSQAATAMGTGYDRVTGATNYGLRFTGLALTWGIPPYSDFKYKKVSFHLELLGFGTTVKSDPSTTPSKGNGSGYEVSEWEYFAMGNEGALNRTIIPLPLGRTQAVSTSTYDTFYLEAADKTGGGPVTGVVPMKIQTFLFLMSGSGTNPAAAKNNLRGQLNPYLNSIGIASV